MTAVKGLFLVGRGFSRDITDVVHAGALAPEGFAGPEFVTGFPLRG